MDKERKIAIIGLGYVGLSLAVGFGKVCSIIGFDKNKKRIEELQKHQDRNHEFSEEELADLSIKFTSEEDDLKAADFYIVTVPTPVTVFKIPDLSFLYSASELVGKYLKKNDIVVYESTVYPGATEEECLPVLEKSSGLKAGSDFKLGYSPERINPGDHKHTLNTTIKIIAAQDKATLDVLADVYGKIVAAGLYRASNIKVAEAAKVIENTQRDLNISLINEIALILQNLNIDTTEVLKAARTKWNFIPFNPGLVGGHCIGVDPYYLTFKAEETGYHPDVILAGRRVNDLMGKYIAEKTIKELIHLDIPIRHCKIAVLGVTFKEDCADIRNSRVFDLIKELDSYGTRVFVHDPVTNNQLLAEENNLKMVTWEEIPKVDAIVLAVSHQFYRSLSPDQIKEKLNSPGLIMDIKSIFNSQDFQDSNILFWRL